MGLSEKDWDRHVTDAEEVARTDSFGRIRDRIVELAAESPVEVAVDIGAGTGLLSLALSPQASRVWAVDISPSMCDYLRAKAASGSLDNIDAVVGSAVSLPLVDATADLVVSNYCFHHLNDEDKHRALREVYRVLKPGGRLVFGDMMFQVSAVDARDRRLILDKVRVLLARGPRGVLRLLKNVLRYVTGRWEKPVRPEWWEQALREVGFSDVQVSALPHEGGLASARRPQAEEQPTPAAARAAVQPTQMTAEVLGGSYGKVVPGA